MELLIVIVLVLIAARLVFATVGRSIMVFALVLVGPFMFGHFDARTADSIRPLVLQLLVMLVGLRVMARGLLG